MVGIVAILHNSLSYVRSGRFKIIEIYKKFYKLLTMVFFFFMDIQMTGGTLTAVIHDAGPSPGSGKWSGGGCRGSTRGVSGDLPREKF